MPRIRVKKPPEYVIKLAKEASALLTESIKNALDYPSTARLMQANHKMLQILGYWNKDGFNEFRCTPAITNQMETASAATSQPVA